MAFDLDFLFEIRRCELEALRPLLPPPPARVLEIGAGAGVQASALAALGYLLTAVDVESSCYAETQVYPVQRYDGRRLPFPSGAFDAIYSSHVLEHVRPDDLPALHREMQRVLAPGGRAVHIVPTTSWRLWTSLTHFPTVGREVAASAVRLLEGRSGPSSSAPATFDAAAPHANAARSLARRAIESGLRFVERRHGERGNVVTELYHFSRGAWRDSLTSAGWTILAAADAPLFYSGNMLMGRRLSLERRARLVRALGSAGHVFLLAARSGREPK